MARGPTRLPVPGSMTSRVHRMGGDPDFLERRGGRAGGGGEGRRRSLPPHGSVPRPLSPGDPPAASRRWASTSALPTQSEDDPDEHQRGPQLPPCRARLRHHPGPAGPPLPSDYPAYGYDDRDAQSVVERVAGSMSILLFEPVSSPAPVRRRSPCPPHGQAGMARAGTRAATVAWVDARALRKLPHQRVDRVDGQPPAGPPSGSSCPACALADCPETHGVASSLGIGMHCLPDDDERVGLLPGRRLDRRPPVFVDNAGLGHRFDLDPAQQDAVFSQRRGSGLPFVMKMAAEEVGSRTAAESRSLAPAVLSRRTRGCAGSPADVPEDPASPA